MSLLVDDRIGSREFEKPLRKMGIPARIQRLKYADFALTIHGPSGPLRVGVERKTVSEMLGATQDNRFVGKQLPGLCATYDVVILVVEGFANVARDGLLMQGKWEAGYGPGRGRHMYEPYTKFKLTLALKARLIVWPTLNKTETCHFLHALYKWGEKPWAAHKSAYRVESQAADRLILDERTIKRQTFAQWPGVGWKRSARVAKYFLSIQDAASANVASWNAALGIMKGTKTAKRLVRVLRGLEPREAKGQ